MNEARSLIYAAQMTMDLYYQNYKSNNDFFDIEHFLYCCKSAFGKILDDEAESSRKISFEMTGYYVIDLSTDWGQPEIIKFVLNETTKKYEAQLSVMPYSFKHDKIGSAIQAIHPISGCKSFVRSSVDEYWKDCFLPSTEDIMWVLKDNKIVALNGTCEMEAEAYVIPSLDTDPEKILLPDDGSQLEIVTMAYNVMATVREKLQAIDMTNNQNPNKTIQTEVDTVYNQLKTRRA